MSRRSLNFKVLGGLGLLSYLATAASRLQTEFVKPRTVCLEFILFYPPGRAVDQVQKDLETIYSPSKASAVDRELTEKNLITKRETKHYSDRRSHLIYFASWEAYYHWEERLKAHSAYDSKSLERMGYRSRTFLRTQRGAIG